MKLPTRPTVLVIGDSHAKMFDRAGTCAVAHFGPLTMRRLSKPGSLADQLNKKPRYRALATRTREMLLLSAGEIDVRCHLARLDGEGIDIAEYCRSMSQNVVAALTAASDSFGLQAGVLELPPVARRHDDPAFPTVGSVADRLAFRTTLNQCLSDSCEDAGASFVLLPRVVTDRDEFAAISWLRDSVHLRRSVGVAVAVREKWGWSGRRMV